MMLKTFRRYSALISNPFSNPMKIRESLEKFPRPNLISFDAFDTLYTPKESVFQQYHDIAFHDYGINKPVEDVSSSFIKTYRDLKKDYPNYGKGVGMDYNDWWKELIVKVFEVEHYSQNHKSNSLCETLLKHFEGPHAYNVCDGVQSTLSILRNHGIKLVVSSNSDPRVLLILKNLGLQQFFDHVYLSYDLNDEKPHKSFFDKIIDKSTNFDFRNSDSAKRCAFLENCWHIGDSEQEDYIAAVKAGWNSIYLNKSSLHSAFTSPKTPQNEACFAMDQQSSKNSVEVIANNRVIMNNFSDLPSLFNLDQEPR